MDRVFSEALSGYLCIKCKSPQVKLQTFVHHGNYEYRSVCDKCGFKSAWNKIKQRIFERNIFKDKGDIND